MNLQLRISILLISLLTISSFISIHGVEKDQHKITWKGTNLASGYQVQIKDSNNRLLVDVKVDTNSYPIDRMKEGIYTVRTAALSPFGKPVVWSIWHRISIRTKSKPISDIANVDEVEEKKTSSDIRIPSSDSEEIHLPDSTSIANSLSTVKPEKLETKEERITSSVTSTLQRTNTDCTSKNIPTELIHDCKEDYITLDLSSNRKIFLYNAFLLGEHNLASRRQAIHFFQSNCANKNYSIIEQLDEILKNKNNQLGNDEIQDLEKAKRFQIQCKS